MGLQNLKAQEEEELGVEKLRVLEEEISGLKNLEIRWKEEGTNPSPLLCICMTMYNFGMGLFGE